MMKRVLALTLALLSVLLCLTGCAKNEADKGAYIRMYLSEPVYDLDPLTAFDNEAALQVISLLYEPLFYADEDGKPQKALVDEYDYTADKEKGEYILSLTLNETYWSDGVQVKANDVVYAFRRLLSSDVSHPAKALLYDIKNARAIADGNDSLDHLRVSVVNPTTVEIEFEKDIDLDSFLVTLCSPALTPLRDEKVDGNPDWAKSRTTQIFSGPFQIRSMDFDEKDGFVIERNAYYYRDRTKDALDESVTPYRIVIDYVTDPVKQLALFGSDEKGAIYYFGHIPLAVRKDAAYSELLEDVDTSNATSTHVYYLNENAEIGGTKLFADAKVRKALSLALDRNKIVDELVYATAADALVPPALLERPEKKTSFRKKADSYIASEANLAEAQKLLGEAGITNPAAYSFSITVAAYDEDHVAMAELAKEAWLKLGFNVTVNKLGVTERVEITYDEYGNELEEYTGIYDDAYKAALNAGDFEVIALDLVATAPTAYSMLAPFATAFSGNTLNPDDFSHTAHVTGYQNAAYDQKIEEAFAADKSKAAAAALREAEAILMEDMPVIPVVYNQNTSLRAKSLKKVSNTFYCNAVFTEAKLSKYLDVALRDGFLTQEELDAAEEAAKQSKKNQKNNKK